jgi:hypothetical protein
LQVIDNSGETNGTLANDDCPEAATKQICSGLTMRLTNYGSYPGMRAADCVFMHVKNAIEIEARVAATEQAADASKNSR